MRRLKSSGFIFLTVILIITFYSHPDTEARTLPGEHGEDPDSTNSQKYKYFKNQRDLIDLAGMLFGKNPDLRLDTSAVRKNIRFYLSLAPVVEYTIATGFSPGIAGNLAFKTSQKKATNTSSFLGAVKYTQKQQFLLPIQSSVWSAGNKFNLVGDWHYLNYPQDTYGIGGHTLLSDKYTVTYKYLRFYEDVHHSIRKNLYAGLGYRLDYHWGIKELGVQAGRITDFQKYGFTKTSSSSGITFELLYDSRENSINPNAGSYYASLELVQNLRTLGSNNNWNSVVIDLRTYIKMPLNTILALWSYNVFTLGGNPPYLDLPGTGSDIYNNTGRGYEQGRFAGKNMIDLEAEIRFKISKNGLLGGVIFGNAESLSELNTYRMEVISPGFGVGLRIKFNKFSQTNACIDYGRGTRGSGGFVGNLGEVF